MRATTQTVGMWQGRQSSSWSVVAAVDVGVAVQQCTVVGGVSGSTGSCLNRSARRCNQLCTAGSCHQALFGGGGPHSVLCLC
jgi:alpha-D-ribose 1-methylphosphonate 5-triphosphate synthase subunit PhnL